MKATFPCEAPGKQPQTSAREFLKWDFHSWGGEVTILSTFPQLVSSFSKVWEEFGLWRERYILAPVAASAPNLRKDPWGMRSTATESLCSSRCFCRFNLFWSISCPLLLLSQYKASAKAFWEAHMQRRREPVAVAAGLRDSVFHRPALPRTLSAVCVLIYAEALMLFQTLATNHRKYYSFKKKSHLRGSTHHLFIWSFTYFETGSMWL